MLEIKQLKCKDILHTGLQRANGQPILILKKIYSFFHALELLQLMKISLYSVPSRA